MVDKFNSLNAENPDIKVRDVLKLVLYINKTVELLLNLLVFQFLTGCLTYFVVFA